VKIVHHAGSTIGSTCMMMTFPDHALDIIVMANRSDSDPTGISLKIAEVLLSKAMEPPAVAAKSSGREFLAGHYYSPASKLVFGIKVHEEKLAFSIIGTPEGFLKEERGGLGNDSTAGEFTLRYETPQAAMRLETVEFENCGIRETLTHLPDTPPTAQDLAADVTGKYLLADFDQPVEVILDQGVLYIDLHSRYNPCRMRLDPIAGDIFIFTAALAGSPFHGTVVMERSANAVSGFFLSTSRTRNLYFSRSKQAATKEHDGIA
jgi:D-aminopeptidase